MEKEKDNAPQAAAQPVGDASPAATAADAGRENVAAQGAGDKPADVKPADKPAGAAKGKPAAQAKGKPVDPVFAANPKLDLYYLASDGAAFYTKNAAENYAATLENKTVKTVAK
jgi:hypothetical protein